MKHETLEGAYSLFMVLLPALLGGLNVISYGEGLVCIYLGLVIQNLQYIQSNQFR